MREKVSPSTWGAGFVRTHTTRFIREINAGGRAKAEVTHTLQEPLLPRRAAIKVSSTIARLGKACITLSITLAVVADVQLREGARAGSMFSTSFGHATFASNAAA